MALLKLFASLWLLGVSSWVASGGKTHDVSGERYLIGEVGEGGVLLPDGALGGGQHRVVADLVVVVTPEGTIVIRTNH
jgi:hypothetical protein